MKKSLLLLLPLLLLSACAETQLAAHAYKNISPADSSKGYFKAGTPYTVAGNTYVPKETYDFEQTGTASWYGPQFHGQHTANGEVFDMYELTAAHKTLQMPSIIRVTNLENGRSAILRVNDRGPFSKSRVLDVSMRAAEVLGFKSKGTAKVKIELLEQHSRRVAAMAKAGQSTNGVEVAMNSAEKQRRALEIHSAPAPVYSVASSSYASPVASSPVTSPVTLSAEPAVYRPSAVSSAPAIGTGNASGIFIQAGAFGNQSAAMQLAQSLSGISSQSAQASVYPAQVNGQMLYRVRLGPLATRDSANIAMNELSAAGQNNVIIVVE